MKQNKSGSYTCNSYLSTKITLFWQYLSLVIRLFIGRDGEFRKKASISFGIQFDHAKYEILTKYLGQIAQHKDLVSKVFFYSGSVLASRVASKETQVRLANENTGTFLLFEMILMVVR